MRFGCRQCPDDAAAFLVGLGLAESDVQSVLTVQGDVAAFEVGEFGAAERAGEAEEQQRGVSAFVDVVGLPVALVAGGVD